MEKTIRVSLEEMKRAQERNNARQKDPKYKGLYIRVFETNDTGTQKKNELK